MKRIQIGLVDFKHLEVKQKEGTDFKGRKIDPLKTGEMSWYDNSWICYITYSSIVYLTPPYGSTVVAYGWDWDIRPLRYYSANSPILIFPVLA